jgi:CBS domain containing-hemolysin-like protein
MPHCRKYGCGRLGIPIPLERAYDTVAGFVLAQLGYLPPVGDIFDAHG